MEIVCWSGHIHDLPIAFLNLSTQRVIHFWYHERIIIAHLQNVETITLVSRVGEEGRREGEGQGEGEGGKRKLNGKKLGIH